MNGPPTQVTYARQLGKRKAKKFEYGANLLRLFEGIWRQTLFYCWIEQHQYCWRDHFLSSMGIIVIVFWKFDVCDSLRKFSWMKLHSSRILVSMLGVIGFLTVVFLFCGYFTCHVFPLCRWLRSWAPKKKLFHSFWVRNFWIENYPKSNRHFWTQMTIDASVECWFFFIHFIKFFCVCMSTHLVSLYISHSLTQHQCMLPALPAGGRWDLKFFNWRGGGSNGDGVR